MDVVFYPAAEDEIDALPERERAAMFKAVEKLEVLGDQLPFPHSSAVRGSHESMRELRPRSGRSPWRGFYRRFGDLLVILAIGPEAEHDKAGFDRALRVAEERLLALRGEGGDA